MPELMTDTLAAGYADLVAGTGSDATDDQLIAALINEADWTEQGAQVVLDLARRYGTSILRNALALASAMQIEDGEAGL